MTTRDPSSEDAVRIAQRVFGRAPNLITRFEIGASHFVYDLGFQGGDGAVVRIGRAESLGTIAGGIYWSKILRPLGVPLPEILHADVSLSSIPFPFMVLERFAGRDLWLVYGELATADRRALAFRLASIQEAVNALPEAAGFGFAAALEGPFPQRSWADVIISQLARSRRWIEGAGVIDPAPVAAVARLAQDFAGDFNRIKATPFLHDITTKNVIVANRKLTGIVDVDDLCFGDPLFLLGLINTALLAHDLELDYVEHWKDALSVSARQETILALYTAFFCVNFMAEIGQRFNREAPEPVDPDYVARLEGVLETALEICRKSA